MGMRENLLSEKNSKFAKGDLQQRLDQQAVSFPASKTGIELRLLKQFFTPEEARLAMNLSYKPISTDKILEAVKVTGLSPEEVQQMLDSMVSKGALRHVEKKGTHFYSTMAFVVGMLELHAHEQKQPNPEFSANAREYLYTTFARAFLSTKVPQFRTIPVEKSLRADHYVTTYDQIQQIINETEGPIAVLECMCRKGAGTRGAPCKKTSRQETCMAFGSMAEHSIKSRAGRPINKAEALQIMRNNQADGLVLQPSNNQKIEFVCSCCGCCCGVLNMLKIVPKPVDLWATNYYAEVDSDKCTGCQTCVERCQISAIKFDEDRGFSSINLDRCLGCGNCVTSCPSGALSLVKKAKETVPPVDYDNLYDAIMAGKKERMPG
jgi:electron transport complex protein RnfB